MYKNYIKRGAKAFYGYSKTCWSTHAWHFKCVLEKALQNRTLGFNLYFNRWRKCKVGSVYLTRVKEENLIYKMYEETDEWGSGTDIYYVSIFVFVYYTIYEKPKKI